MDDNKPHQCRVERRASVGLLRKMATFGRSTTSGRIEARRRTRRRVTDETCPQGSFGTRRSGLKHRKPVAATDYSPNPKSGPIGSGARIHEGLGMPSKGPPT